MINKIRLKNSVETAFDLLIDTLQSEGDEDEIDFTKDNRSAILALIDRQSRDDIFIRHIKAHLSEGQEVICKICGKPAREIIEDEGETFSERELIEGTGRPLPEGIIESGLDPKGEHEIDK